MYLSMYEIQSQVWLRVETWVRKKIEKSKLKWRVHNHVLVSGVFTNEMIKVENLFHNNFKWFGTRRFLELCSDSRP